MITDLQVQEFLTQGVITIDTPLHEEVTAAEDALKRLLPFKPPAPGQRPRYRVGLGGAFEPAVLDLIQHPFFEHVAQRVLAADAVRFFQTAGIISYPEPDREWSFDQHVDIQYCASDFHATPRRVVCSFFLWLTDVNERRAPLMFRPGSHRLLAAHNEQRCARFGEVRTVRGVPLPQLPALDYAEPVPLLAQAGQVSVLTTSAVHGASINVDTSPRTAVVVTFVADRVEIGLPPDQAEKKWEYDDALRPLLRPERQHIVAPPETGE